jgi:predicted RNA-binding Zn ribbon-like protein
MNTGMGAANEFRRARSQVVAPRRDLGIELANTLMWRGSAPEETLHSLDDLLAWLTSTKALPAATVATLRRWFAARPAAGAATFAESIELRETIYTLLHAAASGTPAPPAALRRFNRALADAPARASLELANGEFGWRIEVQPAAASMLAPALWSAADVLAGSDRARLRECANHRCLWLFLDDSKNRTRRWCSMQACGNRAKAHRHYLRSRRG